MRGNHSTLRDAAAGLLVLAALALPVLRMASDGAARMHIHFRTTEMAKPQAFTTETSRDVCAVMAAALTREDPETGEYTHVACAE